MTTHPNSLVSLPLLRQPIPNPIGIPERPNCQLMKDPEFQKDIEI